MYTLYILWIWWWCMFVCILETYKDIFCYHHQGFLLMKHSGFFSFFPACFLSFEKKKWKEIERERAYVGWCNFVPKLESVLLVHSTAFFHTFLLHYLNSTHIRHTLASSSLTLFSLFSNLPVCSVFTIPRFPFFAFLSLLLLISKFQLYKLSGAILSDASIMWCTYIHSHRKKQVREIV